RVAGSRLAARRLARHQREAVDGAAQPRLEGQAKQREAAPYGGVGLSRRRSDHEDDGRAHLGVLLGGSQPGFVFGGPALALDCEAIRAELSGREPGGRVILVQVDEPCALVRHACPYSKLAVNWPCSSTPRRARLSALASAMRASSVFDNSGRMVPLRMKSMLRAPVSTSVQRWAIASIASSATS